MDPIVTTALVGTVRQERVNLATGTPVDTLIAELPEGEIERKFLLSAGAWAIYRQAGKQSQRIAAVPEQAKAEQLRECSPGAALLLSRLLAGEQKPLLVEALERLHQKELRLPYHLLLHALNTTGREIRAAVFPVLGERGIWLSQLNRPWKWVQDFLPADTGSLPSDAETVWQEGSLGQRVEILRRLRAVDPGKACDWLKAVWKQEKAYTRGDFLTTLEVGLSAADEPFLEAALDDHVASVRAMAVSLLTRLPDSAFCTRMRQRGQNMITRRKEKLVVEPPRELSKDWQRDGIVENPPGTVAQRAWWLIQVLSSIEPAFWETHLGAQPTELFKLLAEDRWQMQVMEGWSKAAMSYNAPGWMMPLWAWWCEHHQEALEKRHLTDYNYREQLLKCMPGPVAEQIILDMINGGGGKPQGDWWELLAELHRPWSVKFAQTYLRLLRKHNTFEGIDVNVLNPRSDPWFNDLPSLALALPADCFTEALHPWEVPDDPGWQIQYIRQQLQEFTETIQMRQKIHEEIA
jgi:hypothetical protein